MLRLNVFIQVSADNRAAVMEAAKELVACSLKDNGCIAYDIFESATREDVLMICETWKDEESLAAHEKVNHCVDFFVFYFIYGKWYEANNLYFCNANKLSVLCR